MTHPSHPSPLSLQYNVNVKHKLLRSGHVWCPLGLVMHDAWFIWDLIVHNAHEALPCMMKWGPVMHYAHEAWSFMMPNALEALSCMMYCNEVWSLVLHDISEAWPFMMPSRYDHEWFLGGLLMHDAHHELWLCMMPIMSPGHAWCPS